MRRDASSTSAWDSAKAQASDKHFNIHHREAMQYFIVTDRDSHADLPRQACTQAAGNKGKCFQKKQRQLVQDNG
jgi:hypothetical protein